LPSKSIAFNEGNRNHSIYFKHKGNFYGDLELIKFLEEGKKGVEI
jgi:hypothetical protein